MADKQTPPPSLKHPSSLKNPPAITLPSRSIGIDMFTGGTGASPGPMTLVSSFFAENDPETDCRSFSQLLAGGGGSTISEPTVENYSLSVDGDSGGGTAGFTFQQGEGQTVSQPPEIVGNPIGMSLSNFIDSSGFFNSTPQLLKLGFFWGMNQGVPGNDGYISESQVDNKIQSVYPSFSAAAPNLQQPQELKLLKEPSDVSGVDNRQRTSNLVVDKPSDDGYNWRKYGQKQVKGGDFPRSYYKCTHPSCPVKKKVERSLDGQITEIIYRGQHNHCPPSKRSRDTGNAAEMANPQGNSGFGSESQAGNFNQLNNGEVSYPFSIRDQDNLQVTPDRLSGSSDGEVDDTETRAVERNEDDPESKRRIVEAQTAVQGSSHKTVTEPRIVVQTTSEVDLLDDGYRWRKYGQKVVKGNPNPRSYYKCSHPGCSIRKHVERAATDPKAVITTYEGKHNHDAPTSKNSSNMQMHSQKNSNFK